jgi:hypothetical protein
VVRGKCSGCCNGRWTTRAVPGATTAHRRSSRFARAGLTTSVLSREDTFFDLILVLDVFEHVEDYFGFLDGIAIREGTPDTAVPNPGRA